MNTTQIYLQLIAYVFLAATPLGASTQQTEQDEGSRLVDACVTAFEANRASLSYGVVGFKYDMGKASNEADALSTKFTPSMSFKGFYVFDGARARYECAPLKVFTTGSKALRPPVRVLTDGNVTISFRNGRVYSTLGCSSLSNNNAVPLHPGLQQADESFLDTVDATSTGIRGCKLTSVESSRMPDGRAVALFTFDAPEFTNQFWVDLERGAISLKSKSFNKQDNIYIARYHDDIRKVSDHAWFPFRKTTYFSFGQVHRVIVDTADFVSRPDRSSFRLDFTAATAAADARVAKKVPARKSWDLAALSLATGPIIESNINSRVRSSPSPALPGEASSSSWMWYSSRTLFLGAVLVSGYALFCIKRRGRG